MKTFAENILRNRILQHVVFWLVAVYFLFRNFQSSSWIAPTDLIFTGIFSVFIMMAVYVNLQLLIPKFFQQGKYTLYAVSLIILLFLITYFYIFSFDYIIEWLFPGYYLISYFDLWETLKYFIIFIGLTSLLHFSKSWFLFKEAEARLDKISREKLEAELSALKSQINPHFLFNSLNSIYSLVLKNSDKAPEALIKLSDAMRYIIYESDEEKVPLKKEIDFITNYIELQKLRMSDKDKLAFSVPERIENLKIAPLLLIPVIENGFKYGIKGETEASFINVSIKIDKNSLSLFVKNNLGTVDDIEREKPHGTGLANLKKRLSLIYPGRHLLEIDQTKDNFTVNLSIDL